MRLLISFIITMIIVITIALTGYTFYENMELKEIIKEKNKNIESLDYKNQLLRAKINHKNELIKNYQDNNKRLFTKIRNLKNNKLNNSKNITIRPENNYSTYIQNNQPKKRHTNNYNKTVKQHKRYRRYSGYEKLISDSKIRRRKDGRFVSNSPIYGIYKYRLIGGVSCGGNPKIYKVINECKIYAPYSTDMLFFRKSNINDLKTFNPRNHRIECLYNQEHGLMQDCKVKIFKYLY